MDGFSSDHVEQAAKMTELLSVYLLQGLSPEEHAEMEALFESHPSYKELYQSLQDPVTREAMLREYRQTTSASEAFQAFLAQNDITKTRNHQGRTILLVKYIAAAAIVGLIIGGSFLVYRSKHQVLVQPLATLQKTDVAPGRNTAVLTLDNGETVNLDSVHTGAKVAANGIHYSVEKTGQGELAYEVGNIQAGSHVDMNTLSTPLGGQYQVRLPDGTKVWLNAGSTLRYPVSFAGLRQREVSLSGEAYFEVAKDKSVPFIVNAGAAAIKVLGTHFDIMAYADEKNLETTLLEGSVEVSQGSGTKIIRPNQQASISKNGVLSVAEVDGEDYIAWKNGLIQLHHADIAAVMRQVARWYDVEVDYDTHGKSLPSWTLAGTVPRTLNLSEVIKVLELNGIYCKLDGRKVTVTLDKKAAL
jgi:transmembrane sensor